MKKRIKINGIIIAAAFFLIIIFPKVFFRKAIPGLTEALSGGAGFLLILLGQLIRVSARGYKSEFSRNSHALIESGPYQIVRNPMYLGILFIGLGVVLMLFKLWVAIIFLVIFGARYLPLISSEEKKLKQMFGASYEAYCARLPRLFPRLSSLVKLKVREYLPLKAAWFKKEINSIVMLLAVTLLFFFWKR